MVKTLTLVWTYLHLCLHRRLSYDLNSLELVLNKKFIGQMLDICMDCHLKKISLKQHFKRHQNIACFVPLQTANEPRISKTTTRSSSKRAIKQFKSCKKIIFKGFCGRLKNFIMFSTDTDKKWLKKMKPKRFWL